MNKKINTFIIGAQKAGTTSLYDWLGQHPMVNAPIEIKDYHYFSYDKHFNKGRQYLESFYKKNDTKINLHAAVNYLYFDKVCAKRIYEYNPKAKIIVCLRNPVDRAISAYKYFVRTLRESNSFSDALDLELNQELISYEELSNNTYISHGFYEQQVKTYLNYFPLNQIHFVLFEDLINSQKQKEVMRKISEFLNLNQSYTYNFLQRNASRAPKFKSINYLVRKSGLTKLIKPFVPFKMRKRLGKKIEELNISNKKIEVNIFPEDIKVLEFNLNDKNKNLNKLISSNFKKSICDEACC